VDLTLRKKSKNKRKKTQNEKWFDQDLHKKKKQVKDKGLLSLLDSRREFTKFQYSF
jgi:hypothetical protein